MAKREIAEIEAEYETMRAALTQVLALLQPLTHEARVRVMTSAAIMLEVEPEVSARLVPERAR